MIRALVLSAIYLVFTLSVLAQNVFSNLDSLKRYDPSQPFGSPSNPKSGVSGLQKWVANPTNGVSFGPGSWDNTGFKAYYFRLNGKSVAFRLKFPKSFQDSANTGKKYPMMLFFHGAGEPACAANGGLYNNEKHLLYAAKYFGDKVDKKEFDGFLLFPQIYTTNAGCFASTWSAEHYFPLLISIIDSMEKYIQLDKNRITPAGLSSGGIAAWKFSESNPSLVASIAPSSAVGGNIYNFNPVLHIPIWFATGEIDNNPSLSTSLAFYNKFKSIGSNIRHTVYKEKGHAIWNEHWTEPDFLPFLNGAHKANPLIFFQRDAFCTDSSITAKLGISANFFAYEWSRNDSIIASFENGQISSVYSLYVSQFTGNEITVNSLGVYKVRFKRNSYSSWSEWSPKPAVISNKASTPAPLISKNKRSSKILPDPSGNTKVQLFVDKGYINYEWRKLPDSTLVSVDSLFLASPGTYIARYAEAYGCGSNFSDSFKIFSLDSSNSPKPVDSVSLEEIAKMMVLRWIISDSSITDIEIYKSEGTGSFKLIDILPVGTLTYEDPFITQNKVYNYLIRTVNNTGGASTDNKLFSKKSSRDLTPPTQPQQLIYMGGNANSILARWNSSFDKAGVDHYNIYVNGVLKYNSRDTIFSIAGLQPDLNYNIKVCAVDAAGNTSVFSKEITGRTHRQGLNYKYYEGQWTNIPDYNSLTPVKIGITDSISAGQDIRLRTENYSITWSGYLYIPEDAEYTFETYSDDGSKFYIGNINIGQDDPLINNDGLHAPQSRFGTKYLKKGYHRVASAFFERSGGEEMQLFWSSSSFTRQPVFKRLFSLDSLGILINPIPPNDTLAPSVPGKPAIVDLSDYQAKIKWNKSLDNDEVQGYELLINNTIRITSIDSFYTIAGLDTNITYNVRVRSLDRSGNYSDYGAQTFFIPHYQGLVYQYYEGNWNELPDFNSLEPVKSGISPIIDLTTIPWKTFDHFAALWKGYLYIPEDAEYTFQTSSDDGSKLYIGQNYSFNGPALVNNDGLHGVTSVSKSIFLEKGYHKIAATFFEKEGGEFMDVQWKSDKDTSLQKIPAHYLSTRKLNVIESLNSPDSVRIVEVNSLKVLISWMVNDSLYNGVEIFKSVDSIKYEYLKKVPSNVFSIIDSSVNQNSKYYYRLKTVSSYNESKEVDISIRTMEVARKPMVPQNLVAVTAKDIVQLSWDLDGQPTDTVNIFRRNNSVSDFEMIAQLPAGNNVLMDSSAGAGKVEYFAISKSEMLFSNSSDTIIIITNNRKPALNISASSLYVKANTPGIIRITSSDPDQDSISISISPNILFSRLKRLNVNTWELQFIPERSDAGVYRIAVKSTDPYLLDSTRTLDVYVSSDLVKTVFVNFGHSSIPAPKPWNNFAGVLNVNTTSFNLRDDRNLQTGITIKSLSTFSQLTSLGFNTGTNSGIVPDTILERGVRDPNASRQIIINGLISSKRYNLHFISSVNEGAAGLNYFICNDKRDTVSIGYNAFTAGSLNNLQPNESGQLLITIGRIAGTKYIYLNGLILEEFEKDTVLNPLSSRAMLSDYKNIQISWINRYARVSISDSVQVWRAEDSIFSNPEHLVSLRVNQDLYEDKLIAPGKKYWYKIRYKALNTFSPFSNCSFVRVPDRVIQINLNQNMTGPLQQWNNLNATPTSSISYPELKYDNGEYSGVLIQLKNNFNGENYAGVKTGNNSGIFPDDVLRSNYWLDKEQVGSFIFKGLRQDRIYSIGFLSSISSNGWYPGNYTSTASAGKSKVYLNGWNNASKIVFLDNLTPDLYGELKLELSTTKLAAYGFNTALVLYEYNKDVNEFISTQNVSNNILSVEEIKGVVEKPVVKIFPNPFKDQITVSANIERKNSTAIIRLYDMAGKMLFNKNLTVLQEGNNIFYLQNLKNLAAGNYIIYCIINDKVSTSVITKLK